MPSAQTLTVLSLEPDTMVLPSGEKATEYTLLLCALFFFALSFRDAVEVWEHSGLSMGFEGAAMTPASQTLIVLSHEPDTMVLPSGEKATERT